MDNKPFDFEEFKAHVRLRPAMYVGKQIVIGLIKGLLFDCIKLCNTDSIEFEIAFLPENRFLIKLKSKEDLIPFFNSITSNSVNTKHIFPSVLNAIAKDLSVGDHAGSYTRSITFSLDENFTKQAPVDYLQINDEFLQIALLHRNVKVISIDKRRKFVNLICYYFPEGVLYLFERAIAEALLKPKLKLIFDGKLNTQNYQICIAYRSDWYPEPVVASFANEVTTVSGGSLVDGVVDGLVAACKKFAKETNRETVLVKRKKLMNGLILVCAVNAAECNYGGSFKETLESPVVRKEAKGITEQLILDFFSAHHDVAQDFLSRFDSSNLTNVMY